VTFRYRLLDFDSHGNEAATDALLLLTNLPPGKYRFEVLAANDDGVLECDARCLAFTTVAGLLSDELVIALCIVTLLLATILLVRLRVRSAANGFGAL